MQYKGSEKRRYIRLNSCFPVEFSLVFMDGKTSSKKYEGFTHDVSKGGLCLKVRDLEADDFKALADKKAKLKLNINILPPLFLNPISASAEAVWIEEIKGLPEGKLYNIGISYEDINPRDKDKIINYARRLIWLPRIGIAAIIILLFAILTFYFYQDKIKSANRQLVKELVDISEKRNGYFEKLNNINQERILLEKQLEVSQGKVKELQILNDKIKNITRDETLLKKQMVDIEKKSSYLQLANISKMKRWVSIHRNKKTGLVISYEGDNTYQDWAFTYDQSLAVGMFLCFNDIEKASLILDFYKDKAKSENNLFYNAYDAQTGSPVEYVVHSGPNLWLAIAACKFTKQANNDKYLKFAKDIADAIISMQKQSKDLSIKGGPSISWVSTEHNMDAYALYNMLYELTNDKKYLEAKNGTLTWLKDCAYNKPEARFNRGKGDATIATDTFSWAIAAIGPKTLDENGMSSDAIMEFAEDECRVKTLFLRPDNTSIEVVGFDFAKAANLGRGGIISCEWTAQMIVAFKIMAGYYNELKNFDKASIYSKKADYYLSQLSKMIISSPSPSGQGEGCLPYASIDNVDTGHGWRVAKGRHTGSVSATIYYIFGQKGYNPIKL